MFVKLFEETIFGKQKEVDKDMANAMAKFVLIKMQSCGKVRNQ